jgi:hypothetical protein
VITTAVKVAEIFGARLESTQSVLKYTGTPHSNAAEEILKHRTNPVSENQTCYGCGTVQIKIAQARSLLAHTSQAGL